jgi:asparagine synthase (glutamine-hydrolysing)
MCGIAGIVGGRHRDRALAERMSAVLRHRGPDDQDIRIGWGATLAHRRLSIIDLEGGRQPIGNEDGTRWIVCNGEIYNYRELMAGLEARGHRFRTRSDTEVILHLYEEEGEHCLGRLRGMFAFAIWDERERRLFAARDHLGQKPFFYRHEGDELAFASEIKGLLPCLDGVPRADLRAVQQYWPSDSRRRRSPCSRACASSRRRTGSPSASATGWMCAATGTSPTSRNLEGPRTS